MTTPTTTDTAPAATAGCTTSLLLILASVWLPYLSSPVPALGLDLHDALCEAAVFLGAADRVQAHRAADDVEGGFTTYLVRSGQMVPVTCERCTLRGWLVDKDLPLVIQELRRAASYHHLLHAATCLDAMGFKAFLLGQAVHSHHSPAPLPAEAA